MGNLKRDLEREQEILKRSEVIICKGSLWRHHKSLLPLSLLLLLITTTMTNNPVATSLLNFPK